MPEFTNGRNIFQPNFIGILGPDGAGKSTASFLIEDILREQHASELLGIERRAFAGELKGMVRELDPILGSRMIGTKARSIRLSDLIEDGYTEAQIKAAYPEYRRVLRDLGTKCLRTRDPDFWVNTFVDRHMRSMPEGLLLIVDDVRFVNEASTIAWRTDLGIGAVIKLVGRGTGTGKGEQIDTAHHDVIIENSGDVESTRAQIKEALTAWGWLR